MKSSEKPSFAEVNASNGVKSVVNVQLEPEMLEKLADRFITENGLDEAKVAKAAASYRDQVTAALKELHDIESKASREKYDKSGTKELFADTDKICEELATYRDELLDWNEDDEEVPELKEEAYAALERMLPALTLLVYPHWALDERLSPRVLFYLVHSILKDGEARPLTPDELRHFTDSGVFCDREVTEEFNRQDLLFQNLHELAYAAASRLKELGERDLAIRWLRLLVHADNHTKVYSCNFTQEEAKDFVRELHRLEDATEFALHYAALSTPDEIRKGLV